MDTVHPLRPLALAVSLRLNDPKGLLAELAAIVVPPEADPDGVAHHAHRAAVSLATAAALFAAPHDPAAAVAAPAFVKAAQDAATHLATVADMSWEQGKWSEERPLRKACLDLALGCLTMAGGRVRRPDVNNFLTNVVKAIPSGLADAQWRFAALPDYADPAPPPKPSGFVEFGP